MLVLLMLAIIILLSKRTSSKNGLNSTTKSFRKQISRELKRKVLEAKKKTLNLGLKRTETPTSYFIKNQKKTQARIS